MARIVVPDASVLLKWVLGGEEEDQSRALLIRQAAMRHELLLKVPSLWIYEVGNTLTRRFPRQSDELISALRDFGLEEPAWNEKWLEKAVYLTQQYKVTFYDAAYHSLALIEGGTFVTADQQYAINTRRAGSILTLSEWQ